MSASCLIVTEKQDKVGLEFLSSFSNRELGARLLLGLKPSSELSEDFNGAHNAP